MRADEVGARQSSGDARNHEDRQRAEDRDGEPPAERRGPKRYSPSAMVHLPTGGWTTNSGVVLKMSSVRQLPSDARRMSLALSTSARS